MWHSKIFRYLYFGAYTMVGTYYIYTYFMWRLKDTVWAVFFSIIAFLLGAVITFVFANFRTLFASENSDTVEVVDAADA